MGPSFTAPEDSEALLRLILRNSELTATPLAAAAAAALMANQAAAVAAASGGGPGSGNSHANALNALTSLGNLAGHHHLSSLAGQLPPNSGQLSPNSSLSHDLPMDLHKPSTSTTPPCSSAAGSSPSSSAVSVSSAAAAASLALQSLSAKFPLLSGRSHSPSPASSVQRSSRQYTMSAFPGTSTSRVTTAGSEQIQVHRQADGSLAYSCDFCGFMSNNRHTILRHRRTHTGERPYACTLCSYKAIQMWNLEQHIKRRHPHAAPPSGAKGHRRETNSEGSATPPPPPSLTQQQQHHSMAAAFFGALPPPP